MTYELLPHTADARAVLRAADRRGLLQAAVDLVRELIGRGLTREPRTVAGHRRGSPPGASADDEAERLLPLRARAGLPLRRRRVPCPRTRRRDRPADGGGRGVRPRAGTRRAHVKAADAPPVPLRARRGSATRARWCSTCEQARAVHRLEPDRRLPLARAAPGRHAHRRLIFADDEHDGRARGDRGRRRRWPTWPTCPASSVRRSPCPTSTGATASRSAASRPSILDGGVVSPGGVGYDINCGVRLLRTPLDARPRSRPRDDRLVDALFDTVPSGVGASRSDLRLSSDGAGRRAARRRRLGGGARAWACRRTWSASRRRRLPGRRPGVVSAAGARSAGATSSGTLGSGNHFIEVRLRATRSYDEAAAAAGPARRAGHGHDPLRLARPRPPGVRRLPRRDAGRRADATGSSCPTASCAARRSASPEARRYLAAHGAAANFAFANRQIMAHCVRQALRGRLRRRRRPTGTQLVYDVAHNIAKLEEHTVGRRGSASSACTARGPRGPSRRATPSCRRATATLGQPVLIPGDMGRYSLRARGHRRGPWRETFGSSCHGAGRAAEPHGRPRRRPRDRDIAGELAERGIAVRAASRATVDEEMPEAYKDVATWWTSCRAGIGRRGRAAAADGRGERLGSATWTTGLLRDPGRAEGRRRESHQEGLPQAGAQAPPRRQPR